MNILGSNSFCRGHPQLSSGATYRQHGAQAAQQAAVDVQHTRLCCNDQQLTTMMPLRPPMLPRIVTATLHNGISQKSAIHQPEIYSNASATADHLQ